MYLYCTPHLRCTRSTHFSCFVRISYFLFPFCSSASHQTLQKSIFTCRPSCWRRLMSFAPSCRQRCTLEADRETAAPQVRRSTNRPCICLRNTLNSWFRWPGTSWARSKPGSATLVLSVRKSLEKGVRVYFSFCLSDTELLSSSWFHKHLSITLHTHLMLVLQQQNILFVF